MTWKELINDIYGANAHVSVFGEDLDKIDISRELTMLYKMYNGVGGIDMRIKKVVFNAPATIVMWVDGTKTVVKANDGETFDPEKGLAMAIAKKALGNKGNYYNEIKRWLPEKKAADVVPSDGDLNDLTPGTYTVKPVVEDAPLKPVKKTTRARKRPAK